MIHEVIIPSCYVWMTKGSARRADLFKQYVIGYLAKVYPDMELVRISGMIALCVKK